ncbi:kinase-like domain-containing protein [Xylariales sp. AK1849]|nr:kinase-like domain-containing protein [Xylariales sp. AK1849]
MSTNPTLEIEGRLYRSSTFPSEVSHDGDIMPDRDGLPVITDSSTETLAELLREFQTKNEEQNKAFWSFKLLRHILTRDRILREFRRKQSTRNLEVLIDYIRPVENPRPGTVAYLKIFALLLLLEREHDIGAFIESHMSDQDLPVVCHNTRGKIHLCRKSSPLLPLECFKDWKAHEMLLLEQWQWQVLVPFFELNSSNKAIHYELDDSTILPWCDWKDHTPASLAPPEQEGGYALVSAVNIHPSSHGFHDVLKAIHLKDNRFALKVLRNIVFNDEPRFNNEKEQLLRFSGLAHEHLVTLLATFTLRRRYYFLFPFADCALDQYWEERQKILVWNKENVRWIAKQCSGLIAALDTIHDPEHLHLQVKKYGRHGDIKPDNILWFSSSNDPQGILVISDMGLSSFNRDTSRSNIPNVKIPKVPGYRPPECDIEGGTISRAYDIWTLGCLFLEMLTWLLGGLDFVEKFSAARMSLSHTGINNNLFFVIKEYRGQESDLVVQVKEQVTEWFVKLHGHKHCSEFVHQALDIIEDKMLVVLSQDRTRSTSRELRREFRTIFSKCMSDSDLDYSMKGVPEYRLFRAATAVEARLNQTGRNAIDENQPALPLHVEKPRKSMSPEQFKNLDKLTLPVR